MLLRLAWATLSRHLSRTVLATLGVAVSAAMLLDMVMLSSGMRASLQDLLLSRGFQLRIAPKGTLPFDTEATIADANAVTQTLRSMPGVGGPGGLAPSSGRTTIGRGSSITTSPGRSGGRGTF